MYYPGIPFKFKVCHPFPVFPVVLPLCNWKNRDSFYLFLLISGVHQNIFFSNYQDDAYEAGADPVTFISLLVVIFIYSLIFYSLIRWLLKKYWW